MKKKIWIPILVVVVLAVLTIPIPTGIAKDGGTRTYSALTYKIVDWNRLTGDTTYDKTKVYFFPYNFKSIDSLWVLEEESVEHKFRATVVELNDMVAIVEPVDGDPVKFRCPRISFAYSDFKDIDVKVGSVVDVFYTGEIPAAGCASIIATGWQLSKDLRHIEYTEQWLDKATAEKYDNSIFDHITITEIYSNCFFARTVIPMPYEIKLNGSLPDEWCVGDQIICTYENTYYDEENDRVEADMLSVETSDWQPEPGMDYKPVIYLYPEKEMDISVNLTLDGRLTCT